MAIASDLMGFGNFGNAAAVLAVGGNGPISVTALGSSGTTGYAISKNQYLTWFTTSASAKAATLPTPGGDTGPLTGDAFIIANNSATALSLFCPTNVTLNVIGVQVTSASAISISQYHTLTCWVYNSVQYFGTYN